MSKHIYSLSRIIAISASIIVSISLVLRGYYLKSIMNLVLLISFVFVSKLYEKKRSALTVSYLFIFFILYIVNSLVPGFFSNDNIRMIDATDKHSGLILDYYWIYFFTVLICYLIISLFLHFSSDKRVTEYKLEIDKSNVCPYIIGIFGIGIAYFYLDRYIDMLIPVAAAVICLFFALPKKMKLLGLLSIAFLWLLDSRLLTYRYVLISTVVPTIYFLVLKLDNKRISKLFFSSLVIGGLLCLLLFGTVSEVLKLNMFYDGSYNIWHILLNPLETLGFMWNQLYRMFVIWYKLGGYAIYHATTNGYFWGITFIKSFSSIFGFEYISLPKLVASYHGSNYAQPGLLAEGYANFGILGSVMNICVVFFIMEYLLHRYYKKNTLSNFLLMTVPFTTILLDGGTINSAIVFVGITVLLCNVNLFSDSQRLVKGLKNRIVEYKAQRTYKKGDRRKNG